MNRLSLGIAALVIGCAASAQAQVWTVYRPVIAAPMPVTTFYAPMPVTTFHAPMPVTAFYAPAPVAVRAPVVVPPRYFFPGQPIRNTFRRPVVLW